MDHAADSVLVVGLLMMLAVWLTMLVLPLMELQDLRRRRKALKQLRRECRNPARPQDQG